MPDSPLDIDDELEFDMLFGAIRLPMGTTAERQIKTSFF
jgi:hypothetical protein